MLLIIFSTHAYVEVRIIKDINSICFVAIDLNYCAMCTYFKYTYKLYSVTMKSMSLEILFLELLPNTCDIKLDTCVR